MDCLPEGPSARAKETVKWPVQGVMAYHFDFDPNNSILRVCFQDQIDDAEIREYDANVRKVLAKIHPRGAIVDASAISKLDVSSATVRTLANYEAAMKDQTVPIVVVAPPDHVYGMFRMFQIMSEEKITNLIVVRSAGEAYTRLGVTPKFDPLPELP